MSHKTEQKVTFMGMVSHNTNRDENVHTLINRTN